MSWQDSEVVRISLSTTGYLSQQLSPQQVKISRDDAAGDLANWDHLGGSRHATAVRFSHCKQCANPIAVMNLISQGAPRTPETPLPSALLAQPIGTGEHSTSAFHELYRLSSTDFQTSDFGSDAGSALFSVQETGVAARPSALMTYTQHKSQPMAKRSPGARLAIDLDFALDLTATSSGPSSVQDKALAVLKENSLSAILELKSEELSFTLFESGNLYNMPGMSPPAPTSSSTTTANPFNAVLQLPEPGWRGTFLSLRSAPELILNQHDPDGVDPDSVVLRFSFDETRGSVPSGKVVDPTKLPPFAAVPVQAMMTALTVAGEAAGGKSTSLLQKFGHSALPALCNVAVYVEGKGGDDFDTGLMAPTAAEVVQFSQRNGQILQLWKDYMQ